MVDAVLTASRVLVAIAARSLADAGEEVTLTQYRSLVVLASRGPQSVAALAEAVAVTPPTASRLCERLVRKGLVRRRADRRDRRQVRVGLTETGRRLDRHGDRASPRGDRGPAGIDPPQDQRRWPPRCSSWPRAPVRCPSRTGAPGGTCERGRTGPAPEPRGAGPGRRGRSGPVGVGGVVPEEMDRARRGHRR